MAFLSISGSVVSYCEAVDILDVDQRLFEANELTFDNSPGGATTLEEYLEDLAIKATARINQKLRASDHWRKFLDYTGTSYDTNSVPPIDSDKIISRQSDFTDMTVYYVMKEYLLPKIADWGNPESPEVQKIQYYTTKFNDLYDELTGMWDWYDADGDGVVNTDESQTQYQRTRRTRGRRSIVRVR